MFPISITLVLIERFCAIKKDDWKSSGMGKKAVVISLVFFWILNILAHFLMFAVAPNVNHVFFLRYKVGSSEKLCSVRQSVAMHIFKIIIDLWSLVSTLVVIIGCSILACKTKNPDVKRFGIAPTLAISIIYVTCYLGCALSDQFHMEIMYSMGTAVIMTMQILSQMTWIAFSLTWLITWKKSGEVKCVDCCPCYPGTREEQFQLLETEK